MPEDLIQIALVFLRLGLLAFGGGVAILPEMEREVVTQRGWLTHREFVDSFALGRLTPGPGMLMIVFTGYRVAGIPGAVVAFLALFGPTAVITALTEVRWDRLAASPWLAAARRGLAPIALGLTAAGGYTLFRSAIQDEIGVVFGVVSLFILWKWEPNPALLVIAAGVVGALVYGIAG
jgi:chromate transporter